jgi:hypothetical protein
MTKLIIAIDAGASGGYAIGTLPYTSLRLANWTGEADFLDELEGLQSADLPLEAWLEEVPPYVGRKIPASASFKLGKNYGFIMGAIQGRGIPLNLVRPAEWQKGLTGVRQRKGGDKKRCLRDHAFRLYPATDRKITLKTADAVLVFHYARTKTKTG